MLDCRTGCSGLCYYYNEIWGGKTFLSNEAEAPLTPPDLVTEVAGVILFYEKTGARDPTDYLPLLVALFAHWPDREINLVMDRTGIEDEISVTARRLKRHSEPVEESRLQRTML